MPRPYNNNFNKFEHNFCENNMLNKKIKSLKKYCPQAYKYLIFTFKKECSNQYDGLYEIDLPTTEEFKFVYGQIKLIYKIKSKKIMLIDLMPSDFLMDGHNYDLEVYKSIYYRNSKDKFKIDLFMNKKRGES